MTLPGAAIPAPAMPGVAVIGTGIMGAPIARRLAAAGFRVSAWNRSSAKAAALESAGIRVRDTPASAVSGCDFVISMLSSGPVNEALLLGPDGVIAGMKQGAIIAVMSSIPVSTAHIIAAEADTFGLGFLDAPVSGGETGAIDGTLSIMAGGSDRDFAMMEPVFRHLGRPTHIGPAGSGQLAKLCNQLIVASTICAVAEGLLLAGRGGANPERVRLALLGGFADSTVLRQHGARMIEERFTPGGAAKHQVKDTSTALETAGRLGLKLPVATAVDRLFGDMVAHGNGDLDHSAVILEIKHRSG